MSEKEFRPRPPFAHKHRLTWDGSGFWSRYRDYKPWYDDKADYNTNAQSYYDYLARFNRFLHDIVEQINRLLRRNIEFDDSNSIDFTKLGDWLEHGECDNYDDLIKVSAVVIISKASEQKTLKSTTQKSFTVPNGSKIKNDGVWSPDYWKLLDALDKAMTDVQNEIKNIKSRLDNIENDVKNLKNAIQKILNNLYNSGAITNKNIDNYEFNSGRNIATGNINLFGGTADGSSFIRTNKGQTENDLTAGI